MNPAEQGATFIVEEFKKEVFEILNQFKFFDILMLIFILLLFWLISNLIKAKIHKRKRKHNKRNP